MSDHPTDYTPNATIEQLREVIIEARLELEAERAVGGNSGPTEQQRARSYGLSHAARIARGEAS